MGNILPIDQQFGIAVMQNWENIAISSYNVYETKGRNAVIVKLSDIVGLVITTFSVVIVEDLEEYQAPEIVVNAVNDYNPEREIVAVLLGELSENDAKFRQTFMIKLAASRRDSFPSILHKIRKSERNN